MKSIKRVFEKIKIEHPYWSDYTCFSKTISGKRFSRETISRYFNKLVEKDDYSKRDKKDTLEWLFSLSQGSKNRSEDDQF